MIYPENFESKIKFDKIRQLISNNCLSDMGRELVSDIKFSTDAGWIETSLAETSEFMRICQEVTELSRANAREMLQERKHGG